MFAHEMVEEIYEELKISSYGKVLKIWNKIFPYEKITNVNLSKAEESSIKEDLTFAFIDEIEYDNEKIEKIYNLLFDEEISIEKEKEYEYDYE